MIVESLVQAVPNDAMVYQCMSVVLEWLERASVDVLTSLGIERYNFCKFRKLFYMHEASVV